MLLLLFHPVLGILAGTCAFVLTGSRIEPVGYPEGDAGLEVVVRLVDFISAEVCSGIDDRRVEDVGPTEPESQSIILEERFLNAQ